MASIIPGYQYDVFISYRQKDNRGDRWVSEFVESLKPNLHQHSRKKSAFTLISIPAMVFLRHTMLMPH